MLCKSFRSRNVFVCRIPRLKPNNSEIDHFFVHVPPLICKGERNWVNIVNATFFVDPESVKKHGAIECDYENIRRVTDYTYDLQVTKNFTSGRAVLGDFFIVRCKAKSGASQSNAHASVKPLPEAIKRSRNAGRRPENLNLNVYMFGFDSLSRMTFMRKLPKTYKYIVEQLDGIVLESYNILGDGTTQALIPMLTGQTELELLLARKRYENASFVDDIYPLIWNRFKREGYVTMFGEDGASVGTFSDRLKGFSKQPTDHYLRTFYLVTDDKKKSVTELKNSTFCINSVPQYKVHFRYSEDLFNNYPRSVRKFAFNFLCQLSHDDVNAVEVADDYMVEHLKYFQRNNHSNDTLLIFMADHGHRLHRLRTTQQGKLEERLPFFSFIFPPWFKVRYPKAVENLKLNAHRLTTPFDIHATLENLLNFTYPPKVGGLKERSISLINEIPARRSCEDADIPRHWCTCLTWLPIGVDDRRARDAAEKLVQRINEETDRERKLCSKITLHKIESANVYSLNEDLIKFRQAKDRDGYDPDLSGNIDNLHDYYVLLVCPSW